MQNPTRLITLAAIFAVAPMAAATHASAQVAQPETWRLADIDGSPMPAVVDIEDDCAETIAAATLTLDANGEWTLIWTEQETCGGEIEDEDEDERERGRYTVDGQTVRFLDEDGEAGEEDDSDDEDEVDVDIEELSVGTRSAATLTVRLRDGQTNLVFRR